METLPEPVLDFFTQFLLLEKILPPLPRLEPALLARLLRMDPDDYLARKELLRQQARSAAAQLAADPALAALVGALRVGSGGTIVALGDSLTAEPRSWAAILQELLDLIRPRDGVKVVNAAVPGDTSAQMLARMQAVLALAPDLVICLAGSNDARTVGAGLEATLVSQGETARNLDAMRACAPGVRWVWMTPPGVHEEEMQGHWFWQALGTRCANTDLAALAAHMLARAEPVVDLQAAFGSPPGRHLLLDDGLHPSLAGQQCIVKALLARLAGTAPQ
ncbi:MAG: SGNH/GDSL hydrolase family protein [Pseudomonadota bacterium]